MSDKLWKSSERKIAAMLGGVRVPITGRIRGSAPDIEHEWLSIEVKQRELLPLWLYNAMSQAIASAGPSQLPVVVLHQTGKQYKDDFVVIHLGDFVDWFVGGDND